LHSTAGCVVLSTEKKSWKKRLRMAESEHAGIDQICKTDRACRPLDKIRERGYSFWEFSREEYKMNSSPPYHRSRISMPKPAREQGRKTRFNAEARA